MAPDSMPRGTTRLHMPRTRWGRVKDAILDLEGTGRRIEEEHDLTPEERREIAKNEALEPEPPWLRRENRGPTAREYAADIGYPWVDSDRLIRPMGKWSERVVGALRFLTPRGRRLRTLKFLLLKELSDLRWKRYESERWASEVRQALRMRDWWAEHNQMVEQELIDDLRPLYPDFDESDLKSVIESWDLRHRQEWLERTRRRALEKR